MNKIQEFNALHEENGLLLLGNVWDLLSALSLENAGFKAVGTSSWGIAKSLGYSDGEMIDFEQQLNVIKTIANHVKIPVTADIESGYGHNEKTIVDNVLKLADLGVVGINIEDSHKNQKGLKQEIAQCNLLTKIRNALEANGYSDFFINARTDTYLQNNDPLEETIIRAKAYVESGASGIFVPGLKEDEEIIAVVSEINAPLNIMTLPGLTNCNKLKEFGVRRISLGGALYRKLNNLLDNCAAQLLESQDTSVLFETNGR
ncbi:carboxyphosphonoenolpyruvate phosphonomutase [Paenibacillus ferrarius]|uniref:Carboxyphosphonoenolpyruvate phosphonomutase n=1 Tax=Paenibacillus ferrarius TaxID=1469647 RepID=A0A1V4HK62_9BACL|nr:isocitrate lyase/phosphoenolpyruvate mutase family protein [Paenibacillus ferrarius]OPH57675.1 carboxyphosphonoenolpyruvate phosphonomutase [Paenibacillus ferrarius]